MSTKCDVDLPVAVNVRWTSVDKGQLVELVDQLTAVGDFPLRDDRFHSRRRRPSGSVVGEPRELHAHGRHPKDSGASQESFADNVFMQDAASWARAEMADKQQPETAPATNDEVSCSGLGENGAIDLSPAISSSQSVPENRDAPLSKVHRSRKPVVNRTNGLASGSSGKVSGKAVKGSAEVWTSVDKSLVEDLFDQLLRSFDDIKVAAETGSGGSRDPPSANQRPSTADLDSSGSWNSAAAYKWKSHLLRRMRSQQSTTRDAALCRKRRYADRKLIQTT